MNWREKSHFALPLGSSNVGTIESMINAMCTSMSLIPLKQRSVTLKQECEKQLPALCFKHLFKHVQLKHSCKKCRHRIWVLFREKKQPLSLCFHERSMLVCWSYLWYKSLKPHKAYIATLLWRMFEVVLEVASRKFVSTKSRVQESNELELHGGMWVGI